MGRINMLCSAKWFLLMYLVEVVELCSFSPRAGTSELVMLSLELVKTRLAVMSMEMRKNFIQAILTSLIEKSPDAKILRAVVKIVEEWVKNNSPMAANQVSWEEGLQVGQVTFVCKRKFRPCFLSFSSGRSHQAQLFSICSDSIFF